MNPPRSAARVSDSFRRHQLPHADLHAVFGTDRFGGVAERVARFFGTPEYILGQSVVVVIWIALNVVAIDARWDPYPFILLNLAFSTQAAYAAPLILLAQTRQADRDKAHEEAAANHRDEIAATQQQLLAENTELTRQVATLTAEIDRLTRTIHAKLVDAPGAPA